MNKKKSVSTQPEDLLDLSPGQSIELLKALHILTRDGKINQDSRRKLKQVKHLVQFIQPLISQLIQDVKKPTYWLVDHGAGKSYLGFILYDLILKNLAEDFRVAGIETRPALVEQSIALAKQLGFAKMAFLNLPVIESITSPELPAQVDIVTALHACDTATDDAIYFGLQKQAQHMVLVPCCQAEVASVLKKSRAAINAGNVLTELWRHPLHAREFGSQLTNVLRCLQLQAHGYSVTVTELIGWEHSMKNELIIASRGKLPRAQQQLATQRLREMLETMQVTALAHRFLVNLPETNTVSN